MDRIRKIKRDEQEVIVLDFSDLKESQMMQLVSDGRELFLREQRPLKVMGVFNGKNFITPKFMRHFESDRKEALVFLTKQAVVGLTDTQKMILKGYNMHKDRDIRVFSSEKEALEYLINETPENISS